MLINMILESHYTVFLVFFLIAALIERPDTEQLMGIVCNNNCRPIWFNLLKK